MDRIELYDQLAEILVYSHSEIINKVVDFIEDNFEQKGESNGIQSKTVASNQALL